MATTKTSTLNPALGSDPPPASLAPEEIVRNLRAIRDQIVLPDPAPAAESLRGRLAHVNADFVQAAINAAGTSETIQSALGRTDEDLRQETDATARWTAVADELRALLQRVVVANSLRRQRIGLAALQTYKICQQLARDKSQATLLDAHIAEMKRLNRFGRRRKAQPAAAKALPEAQPNAQ